MGRPHTATPVHRRGAVDNDHNADSLPIPASPATPPGAADENDAVRQKVGAAFQTPIRPVVLLSRVIRTM